MLAHVYSFVPSGPTAPWVYSLIGVAFFTIVAVHIYRILRKKRARRRRRSPPAGARPILLGTMPAKCFYVKEHTLATACMHIPEWHCEDCPRRPAPGPDGLLPYPELPGGPGGAVDDPI